jgi:mono/diheme cytochrome c family protein
MIRFFVVAGVSATLALTIYASGLPADDAATGKKAFERVCQVCHGEGAKGGAGPSLVPFDRDVEDVLAIVRDGTGEMPPVSTERVSDDEIRAIVAYLTSLTPPAK